MKENYRPSDQERLSHPGAARFPYTELRDKEEPHNSMYIKKEKKNI